MRERIGGMLGMLGVVLAIAFASTITAERPAWAQRGNGTQLRTDQIRTRYLVDGSVTAGKLALKIVSVSVTAGAATGSSAADATLAGGTVVGCVSAGNQDQFIDNVVLNADGSITITLAANATATNTFKVSAVKANAKGVT